MLKIENLSSGYGRIPVLQGVSLEIKPGEIVALIGPNGAGKSTVLKSIFNLAEIYSGKIFFKGREITSMPTHNLLELGISFVPQGRLIFPSLSIEENLLMGAYLADHQETKKKSLDSVYNFFPVLKEKRTLPASSLSGGQQQMLAIGRALMMTPQILLLDEPSLGLAPKIMKEIYEKIREINRQGTALLIVEQNVHLALEVANRVYLLSAGQVRHQGPPSDFKDLERMRALYLGS